MNIPCIQSNRAPPSNPHPHHQPPHKHSVASCTREEEGQRLCIVPLATRWHGRKIFRRDGGRGRWSDGRKARWQGGQADESPMGRRGRYGAAQGRGRYPEAFECAEVPRRAPRETAHLLQVRGSRVVARSHCWSQGGGAIADGPRVTARGRRRQEAAGAQGKTARPPRVDANAAARNCRQQAAASRRTRTSPPDLEPRSGRTRSDMCLDRRDAPRKSGGEPQQREGGDGAAPTRQLTAAE
jgi:hypothetical protein